MKRLLLIAIVVPLLVAASAQAKGLKWVEVCGPTDCNRTPGRDLGRSVLIFPPWVMSGAPDKPPKQAGEWLRVRVRFAHSNRRQMRSVVMPTEGYAGGAQGGGYGFVWERLSVAAQETYLRLARGIERYPAETLPGLSSTTLSGLDTAVSGLDSAAPSPVTIAVSRTIRESGRIADFVMGRSA